MFLFLINQEKSFTLHELFSYFFRPNCHSSIFFIEYYLHILIFSSQPCIMYMSFLGEVKTSPFFPLILVRLCCRSFFLFDLFYHTYRISRMYSKENPKDFRFPVSGFYPSQWVMLFLRSKASFQASSSFTAEFRA